MRHLFCLIAILASTSAHSQTEPKHPSTLPMIDWQCYASFTVSFAPPDSSFQELGLDGDNLKKPRIELHTVAGVILKVIENPSILMTRKEYSVEPYKLTEDFSRKNPVFAWREDLGYQVKIFALNLNDHLLSITRVMKPPNRALNENEVLVCK